MDFNTPKDNGTTSGKLSIHLGVCNPAGSVLSNPNMGLDFMEKIKESKEIITGIYKITPPVGLIYIGKSKNIYKRWVNAYFDKSCAAQPYIYDSLIAFGPESHSFEIIRVCSFKWMGVWEVFHQRHHSCVGSGKGLNVLPGSRHQYTQDELIKLKIRRLKKILSKRSKHGKCINGKRNIIKTLLRRTEFL